MEEINQKVADILIKKGLTIATAESCTGGLLSSKLTDISGSSSFVRLNLITYANEAKMKMLNVKSETLDIHGAVSRKCSYEMAEGLYKLTGADICVSTTGIAGPTGGSKDKPVGLMFSTIYTPKRHESYKVLILPENLDRLTMKKEFCLAVLNNIYTFLSFV